MMRKGENKSGHAWSAGNKEGVSMSTSDDNLTAAVFHRSEATKRIHGNKRCGSSRVRLMGDPLG
jgi:hypothetical protein